LKKFIANNAAGYLFLLPWFFGIFGLTLYPMAMSVYYSFTEFSMLKPPEWIGVENYVRLFTNDARYLNSLGVTFRFVFLSVPIRLAFALFIAIIMNQKLRLIGFYRTVYYIPSLLGGSVAIAILWRQLFLRDGVVNAFILELTGWQGPAWIAHPDYALYAIILLGVWQFGSSMIIFLAGLKQIPVEYYEAASVDGATKWQQFLFITIPALTPVIFFNLVMQMISAFQSFTQVFIISGGAGGPIDSTMFYSLYLFITAFSFFEMGYASSMAWILLTIIAVFTALVFKSSSYWVSYGEGR